MSTVIWFNDGLSVMAEAIQALREAGNDQLKIIVSHKNPYFVGFDLADTCHVEGAFGSGSNYVEWALAFAAQHQVTHFFVGRHAQSIAHQSSRFEQQGVTLMYTLTPDQWNDIDDKAAFYTRLSSGGHDAMLPIWFQWTDSYRKGLKPLVDRITEPDDGGVERKACVKPVRGIFGQGFFLFNETPDAEQQIFFPEQKVIRFDDFGKLACAASLKAGKPRDWMVMEYLPGPEYSVDTLAYEGHLVTHVARRKGDSAAEGQVIVDDQDIREQLTILAEEFRLSGVFNAQFRRDVNGKLKVLEINPRFSGGMGMSLLAGVNLPWWWLQLEQTQGGCLAEVPQARTGLRVYSWHRAVVLSDHRQDM